MSSAIRYLKVEKDLRRSIIGGSYESGQMLPSENDLCDQYGISRMTVRKALNNLEIEGLISRKKGKGSFVRSNRSSIELLSIKGFTEIMKSKERQIETLFLQETRAEQWEEDFYWELSDKDVLNGAIFFSRIRKLEGKPIMFEKTYLPNRLPKFCSKPFINDSLFDTLLVNYDIEIKDVVQKFRAIAANEDLAKSLRIKINQPVLEIIRKLSTSWEDFHIYSFAYCNTNEFMIET